MSYNGYKDNFLNKNFDYIVSASIKEYDMRDAGFNILISEGALNQRTIDYLAGLPKQVRKIKLGLMQKENKELTKIQNEGFRKYRKLFLEANELTDDNIISVHKDAIIVVNKRITKTKFDTVEFRPKERYSSYYHINNCEYYYSKLTNDLSIKGLGKSTSKPYIYHKEYMIKTIKKIIKLNEVSRKSACIYLRDFMDKYRKMELKMEYYRELNNTPYFTYILFDHVLQLEDPDPILEDCIDINYNYDNILMEFVRMIY